MYEVQALYQKAMKYAEEKHHKQLVPGSKTNYLLGISNVPMEVLFIRCQVSVIQLYLIELMSSTGIRNKVYCALDIRILLYGYTITFFKWHY